MTFYVQNLNSHEVMPLMQLFNQHSITKANKVVSTDNIKEHEDRQQNWQTETALNSYHQIADLKQSNDVLIASQIMTTPVITLKSQDTIKTAVSFFKDHQLRHIPVVDDSNTVQGIISDRDLLHYLSGMTKDYHKKNTIINYKNNLTNIMTTNVLTASKDTDVRYIARLIVEQRVGAMPIVVDGIIMGIISRSDLLSAIMQHFKLELWT
ncbi:hypothetical protein MNBD_GAMMA22-3019 [hydrothermal vent metagenome]|uniref:CBS domain-containing protein n=1 Tax=hydrothermal vent metagenome TaxID=652676 RepID=A0A3B0ZC57_9ZZZZ